MSRKPDDVVRSCRKLESGLRLGTEGIHACQPGPFSAPLYWTAEEASRTKITKGMIEEKRRALFEALNDGRGDIPCRQCHMVKTKLYKDVDFTRLGHVDLAPSTICNLRCSFCGYTMRDSFSDAKYDALAILEEFSPEDVEWDSAVDFNGGEPAILPDTDKFLEYFISRRVRVFLYTNAVVFRQSIFDGLVSGSIRWVCSSLDAGTPSTFLRMKKKDSFLQALENLARYADAGSRGGGRLAVKYIFCADNCSDDDISGFAYAMLAIRPQEVWLTFDFEPFSGLPPDVEDLGGLDYSRQVSAYAKLYCLLVKHGLTPVHFLEKHLATVCRHGKILLDRVRAEIGRVSAPEIPELRLDDFRKKESSASCETASFCTGPLRILKPGQEPAPWSLEGRRVLLAPACALSTALLNDSEIKKSQILGFLDRDPVLRGKKIGGTPIFGYDELSSLNPDFVLMASPEQHKKNILAALLKCVSENVIIVLTQKTME